MHCNLVNVCYFPLAELRLCRRCRYNAGTPPLSLFLPAHSPVSSNLAEMGGARVIVMVMMMVMMVMMVMMLNGGDGDDEYSKHFV